MTHPEFPFVSAQEFAAVADTVAEMFGHSVVKRVFRVHGFSERILTDPELQLPNAEYMRFLEACARETGKPLFGAMIGESLAFSDLGTYGAYVTAATSLSEALRRACRALRYHESGSSLVRSDCGAQTALVYLPPTPKALGTWHQCDGVAAMLINLVRSYVGPQWRPDRINLVAATDERRIDLEHHFEVPVHSRKIGAELRFSSDILANVRSTRIANEQKVTFSDLRRMVSKRPPRTFRGVFAFVLNPLLHEGISELDQVAEKIGLGARTIQRRLSSEGTTFGALLQEARQEWALELLTQTDASIREIGERLGYSSKQHFIRAFRAWTGTTPGSFRQHPIMGFLCPASGSNLTLIA